MTGLLVTLDTNVLASGIVRLRAHPEAATARIVRAWQAGRFILVHSEPLLAELVRTVAKPYFAGRLREEDRLSLLRLLERHARMVSITAAVHGVAPIPRMTSFWQPRSLRTRSW